jgi:hypothetical protein
MLYLPLDRLLEQRGQPRSGTVTVEAPSTLPVEGPLEPDQPDLRSRGNR